MSNVPRWRQTPRNATSSATSPWWPFALLSMFLIESALAAPVLTFSPARVEAAGITAGGDAIWLAASVEPFNGSIRLWNTTRVTRDDDRDGRVTLDADVQPFSIWVVVDYESGDYVIARPDGLPTPPLFDRVDGWSRGATHLDFSSSDAHILLVRRRAGAWAGRSWQGARGDADGRHDGNLRVKLAGLTPILGDKDFIPPVALPNDLLIVIDTHKLSAFVRRAREER